MQLSDFLYQLDELLELSKLPPNSRKFDRQADCLIRTNYDLDSLDFPEKAHWERVQIIWSIVGCALFVLYLVGLLLYAKYTQKNCVRSCLSADHARIFDLLFAVGLRALRILQAPSFSAAIHARKTA